ncbi:MAG: hypothetical protein WAX69_24185 [Victivallales bacterium]
MDIRIGTSSFKVTVTAPMTGCMDEYGPRFDTLGAVTSIRVDGLEFCSREGLIDEFNIQPPLSPPGFDEAKPGETFLKIGVGELVRPDKHNYMFSHPYTIKKPAPVTVRRLKNSIAMKQSCRSGNAWGYEYRKTIRINPAKAVLEIDYHLKNTGTQVFKVEQYNHNWFNLGGKAVDQAYTLEHPFPTDPCHPSWLKMQDGRINLTEKMTKPHYYPSLESVPAKANRIKLSHSTTGRSVTASGDFAVARFAFYLDQGSVCPEIFARATLKPGKSAKWTRRYEFQV